MADANDADLTTLTVQLLSAYVTNNQVPSSELAGLIQTTRAALSPAAATPAEPEPEHKPAVTVRKSLGRRDAIISMIDGRPYKSLKRHLSSHGLSPAEYRERYNLPKDYPMVAPGYSEQRREVAKRLGLGRKPAAAVSGGNESAATEAASPSEAKPPAAPAATKVSRRSAAPAPADDTPAKAARPRARKDNGGAKAAATEGSDATVASKAKTPRKRSAPKSEGAAPADAPKPRRGRKPAAASAPEAAAAAASDAS